MKRTIKDVYYSHDQLRRHLAAGGLHDNYGSALGVQPGKSKGAAR